MLLVLLSGMALRKPLGLLRYEAVARLTTF